MRRVRLINPGQLAIETRSPEDAFKEKITPIVRQVVNEVLAQRNPADVAAAKPLTKAELQEKLSLTEDKNRDLKDGLRDITNKVADAAERFLVDESGEA
ncbi:MAG: hypothetical protein ABSF45_18770 [Terriglobia bacterium]|jgi:hypothetical protein